VIGFLTWDGEHLQIGLLFWTLQVSYFPQLMILQGSTQLLFPLMLMLQTLPEGQSFCVLQLYSGRQPAVKSEGFPEKPSMQMQVLWWLSVTHRELGPHWTLPQASTHLYWPFTDWQISL
jgi:hypothetical protein